jgi:hypothetical protein
MAIGLIKHVLIEFIFVTFFTCWFANRLSHFGSINRQKSGMNDLKKFVPDVKSKEVFRKQGFAGDGIF